MAVDVEDLKVRRICIACVREPFLQAEIKRKGNVQQCAYCAATAETYTLEELAEPVTKAFDDHYVQLNDESEGGVPVVDAIEDAVEMPREAAEDLQQVLAEINYDHRAAKHGEEVAFSDDAYYEQKRVDGWDLQHEWIFFEKSLKSEARFFSRSAVGHLASIFGGIDKMVTHDGRAVVVGGGPAAQVTHVYRARVFQSEEDLKNALCRPDELLGPPQMVHAAAGRMNARGISVFYGANEARVAIAEVRPPVGSQVAVARFDILRPIRLLDLGALSSVSADVSIFEPGSAKLLERAAFLRTLTDRMTRPVMPDDEAFDYLPTQAVSDFLATENSPALDGIIFPSVQAAGDALNIVLFHKAARVADIDIPKGAEISARTGTYDDDGWDRDYSVHEIVPPVDESPPEENTGVFSPTLFLEGSRETNSDPRDPALRIDLTSIKVHVVNRVQFDCTEYDVRRVRSTRE